MRIRAAILSVTAIMLAGTPAMAQTLPVLQGTYLLTYSETCQATFQNAPTGGGIETINNGKISNTTGKATFTPGFSTSASTNGSFAIKGWQTNGTLIIVEGLGGTAMTDTEFNITGKYNISLNTFTLNGTKFDAAFSPSTGIVTSAVYGGMDNTGCSVVGTLQQVVAP